jgi:hypothetical protein
MGHLIGDRYTHTYVRLVHPGYQNKFALYLPYLEGRDFSIQVERL